MSVRRARRNVTRVRTGLSARVVVGFATAFVAGVVAMHAGPTAPSPDRQQVVTSNLLDDPLAKFAKLMPDVTHPRCMNCHGITDPFTGANHPVTIDEPENSRIRDAFGDHNFALELINNFNTVCRDCHNDARAQLWGLAPKFKSFVNKTPYEICSLWQTTKKNSAAELRNHFNGDPLATLAFEGSQGIDGATAPRPPLNKSEFMALAEDWLRNGDDIPCAGWVGTITQTERVNLTTTHSTVMGNVEEHTTEVQDATRTVEVTVEGTVSFRIIVQGLERIDTTIITGEGAQKCTAPQLTVRSYGTGNGVASGEAQTATLAFLPGGSYSLSIEGPEEQTRRVERISSTYCGIVKMPDEVETLTFDHPAWTFGIDGVLPNPSDRTQLKGTKTETVTREGDAWLTTMGSAVTPLQTRDNGDLLPVPVEVTTTWDLRRRE